MGNETPWTALRTDPAEGVDGWWINKQPHPSMRGFTENIGWMNGGDENEGRVKRMIAAVNNFDAMAELLEELAGELESEIRARFGEVAIENYPSEKRRFDSDMTVVLKTRAFLTRIKEQQNDR